MAYSVESAEDGVYSVNMQTRYNAGGEPLITTQKQLISQLSATLASKSISTDERGNIATEWSEFTAPSKVTSYSTVPTSEIVAEAVSVDGFTTSQKDYAGITTSATRSYTATGMILVHVDGRGNATTTATDLAGRTISVTDATGAVTTTAYDAAHDLPSVVTDAMGNTSCYKYDERGRKVAEWGTAIQPACFGYDDMDNVTSLRTFRADVEVITTDPSERSDYDETTWTFNAVTGLEISKTYADNSSVVKTYDAYNRLATETDARGNIKTHAYEHARGLHLGTTYTVVEGTAETYARSFSYNHLGQMVQQVDDAGTRTFTYNTYGERETDSLVVDGDTHLITEQRDSFGRSTGYTYAKNGSVQQTVSTGYGADGRIASAGFLHGGMMKQFGYEYLQGSNLLSKLTKPNGMTLTQTYETTRDLLTGMAYHRGSTLVAQREYTYDVLGRPTARTTSRQGNVVNDTFTHNTRSELAAATVNSADYAYLYDNIGNRTSAEEGDDSTVYTANPLNQYTSIAENNGTPFVPQFDSDGNQTLIKTETGIWSAIYNAENRPVSFTNSESNTVVECAYDSQGRRAYKKVTVNGSVTLHQRYIYRGYLQIACLDLTRSHHPCLWLLTWDPSQPDATSPLTIQINGTWYTYGWDISKNVCELFSTYGTISTSYTYTPFGSVRAIGSLSQPIQWNGEVFDEETGLVYYNYRYFNNYIGDWTVRDFIEEIDSTNLYKSFNNNPIMYRDYIGLWVYIGSSLYRAETGDTLKGLAKKLTNNEEDWPCLWPNDSYWNQTMKRRYPNVCPGDTYDVSNLSGTETNNATFVIERDFISVAKHYDLNASVVRASRLAKEIRDKAEEGAKPISRLVVFGHGTKRGNLAGSVDTFWGVRFGITNINDFWLLNQKPTYKRARRKKGPIRCWFKNNSAAIFTACHSENFASPFAKLALRKTSYAVGSNQMIGLEVKNGKLNFAYGYITDPNTKRLKSTVKQENTTWAQIWSDNNVWKKFDGGLK